MARYFQHINQDDTEHFGKVTELMYIDDISDTEMVFFIFSDGTKCNKELVATINTPDPYKQYAMIEVESAQHVYKFEKIDVDFGDPVIKAVNTEGKTVYIPNPNYYDSAGVYHEPKTMNVVPPRRCIKNLGDIEMYYLTRITELVEEGMDLPDGIVIDRLPKFLLDKVTATPAVQAKAKKPAGTEPVAEVDNTIMDFNTAVEQTEEHADVILEPADAADTSIISKSNPGQFLLSENDTTNIKVLNHTVNIRLDDTHTLVVTFDDYRTQKVTGISLQTPDGNKEFTIDGLIRLLTKPAEKFGNLKVDEADPASEELVKGMIAMSAKEDSDIEMTLGLQIPPKDLFSVIQKVYTEKHTKMFVNTISNQIPETVLRQAIAEGLFEFYTKQ